MERWALDEVTRMLLELNPALHTSSVGATYVNAPDQTLAWEYATQILRGADEVCALLREACTYRED